MPSIKYLVMPSHPFRSFFQNETAPPDPEDPQEDPLTATFDCLLSSMYCATHRGSFSFFFFFSLNKCVLTCNGFPAFIQHFFSITWNILVGSCAHTSGWDLMNLVRKLDVSPSVLTAGSTDRVKVPQQNRSYPRKGDIQGGHQYHHNVP